MAALQAGNDVLLFPEDIPAAFTAIKKAIQDSLLTEDRINQSCHKILKAKEWLGLTSVVQIDTLNVLNRAQNDDSELLIRRLEEAALTLLKNTNQEIPISELKNQK